MGWSGEALLWRGTVRQTPDVCAKLRGKSTAGGGTGMCKGPGGEIGKESVMSGKVNYEPSWWAR